MNWSRFERKANILCYWNQVLMYWFFSHECDACFCGKKKKLFFSLRIRMIRLKENEKKRKKETKNRFKCKAIIWLVFCLYSERVCFFFRLFVKTWFTSNWNFLYGLIIVISEHFALWISYFACVWNFVEFHNFIITRAMTFHRSTQCYCLINRIECDERLWKFTRNRKGRQHNVNRRTFFLHF